MPFTRMFEVIIQCEITEDKPWDIMLVLVFRLTFWLCCFLSLIAIIATVGGGGIVCSSRTFASILSSLSVSHLMISGQDIEDGEERILLRRDSLFGSVSLHCQPEIESNFNLKFTPSQTPRRRDSTVSEIPTPTQTMIFGEIPEFPTNRLHASRLVTPHRRCVHDDCSSTA